MAGGAKRSPGHLPLPCLLVALPRSAQWGPLCHMGQDRRGSDRKALNPSKAQHPTTGLFLSVRTAGFSERHSSERVNSMRTSYQIAAPESFCVPHTPGRLAQAFP